MTWEFAGKWLVCFLIIWAMKLHIAKNVAYLALAALFGSLAVLVWNLAKFVGGG